MNKLISFIFIFFVSISFFCCDNPNNSIVLEKKVEKFSINKLLASDKSSFHSFGKSVAINKDIAVVGAYRDGIEFKNGKAGVYVFVRKHNKWTQQAKLSPKDRQSGDHFGESVAIDNSTIVVSARRNKEGEKYYGAVYVFIKSGDSWIQQTKLLANDRAVSKYNNGFGTSVAIDNDTIVVGAEGSSDDGKTENGAVYIFNREGNKWTQQAKLTANDKENNEMLGRSVGIDNGVIVVGTPQENSDGNTSNGAVYVFTGNGNTWTQQAKLLANDKGNYDYFGHFVAIEKNTIVISAFAKDKRNDRENSNNESVYVFTRNGEDWIQQAKLLPKNKPKDKPGKYNYFGSSIAIQGNIIVVGASLEGNDGNQSTGGALYVFARKDKNWSQVTKFLANDKETDDYFGNSVAINGNTIIVGAIHEDSDGKVNNGAAYIISNYENNSELKYIISDLLE